MFSQKGIPIFYYGTEHQFTGFANNNTFPLWTTWLNKTELYNFTATILQARTQTQWYKEPIEERWCDILFYAYTRGKALFVFSVDYNADQGRSLKQHPYQIGDVLSDILDPTWTIKVLDDGSLPIVTFGGRPRIFIPVAS